MPDTPCNDCNQKIARLEAIQSDRIKWERKAMVLISDAIPVVHSVNRGLADQLMKLLGDLNRIGLADKESAKV